VPRGTIEMVFNLKEDNLGFNQLLFETARSSTLTAFAKALQTMLI